MLNSSLIKSLCQISAIVYKPQKFFIDNYSKTPRPKGCECFEHLSKQPVFMEVIIMTKEYK